MANYYNDNKSLKFHLTHPLMEKIVRLKENNFADKDKFDYASLDFEDTIDSYEKVLQIIGEISADVLAENAESVDKYPPQLINNEVIYAKGTIIDMEAIKRAGLFGMSLPRQYGGLNFSMVPYVMAAEIVARGDAGFCNIWGLQDCAETIHEFASEEIKNNFLHLIQHGKTASMDLTEPDAGSDLQAVQLKATYHEQDKVWYLNGVKRFITNGDADIHLVLARSEEGTNDGRGLSLFLYDRNDSAMTIRRIENKLGIKGAPTCELVFRNAPALLIGERRLGLIKYVMSLMNSARLGVGAQSVGIAESACREAFKYAAEREQFGKSIDKFPAIYELLSNMQANTDAIRTLLYETSRSVDIYKSYAYIQKERKLDDKEKEDYSFYQKSADLLTPLLKLFASEYCNKIAYDALQVHGGTGYMKDFPIERIFRDARITNIYEGTSQLQVVSAIRGIGNGTYLNMIKEYQARPLKPEFDFIKSKLIKLTEEFEHCVQTVTALKDNEYIDFHARRMVEMAGNIIVSYLMLLDANRDNDYKRSAEIFIKKAISENAGSASFILNTDIKEMDHYKQQKA